MSGKALLKSISDHKEKLSRPHFIFSAENPKYPKKNEVKLSHKEVLGHLQGAGYDAHEVDGHYGAPEKSIIVYGVNKEHQEKLHGLAAKLGQDSSIHSDGTNHEMRFHHGDDAGKKITGSGTQFHKEKPADFYTTLPGGVHHFTHNFDFDKSESLQKKEGDQHPEHIELTTYHGSDRDFDRFDTKHQRSGFYPGVYSTTNPDRAKEHGSVLHTAKISGKYKDLTHPDSHEKVSKELLGHVHQGSGHPLAQKLQEMGYSGIKRGNEYITFHHDDIKKINKNENLNKSAKDLAIATAVGVASLSGVPTKTIDYDSKPKISEQASEQTQYNRSKMLQAISDVESSGGKFIHHRQLGGIHQGESAYGKYGLTPNVIRETVKMHDELNSEHGKVVALKGQDLHNYMDENPDLEHKVAEKHVSRLEHHFGQSPSHIGYAWLNGITGTHKAKKQNKDIENHWHVQKIKEAYSKE